MWDCAVNQTAEMTGVKPNNTVPFSNLSFIYVMVLAMKPSPANNSFGSIQKASSISEEQ